MDHKTLLTKLNFKSGMVVLLRNVPKEFQAGLTEAGLKLPEPGGDIAEGSLFMVENRAKLDEVLPEMKVLLKTGNILWIAYPKGSSGVKSDLNRDILWKLLEPHHFRAVRQVAIDDVWSALRFKEGDGPLPSANVNKSSLEIILPDDLTVALSMKTGAVEFFHSLAYTHRKEYVRWIEEAKRPETRADRIKKSVLLLLQKKKLND